MEQRKGRIGRPAASSRVTLEEAAGELALERGWDDISVADIAVRAGVSRSSFFNYFTAKSDVIWASFDEAVGAAETLGEVAERLEESGPPAALTHAEAMGAQHAITETALGRARKLVPLFANRPCSATERIHAEMRALGIVLTVAEWAAEGVARPPLGERLVEVLGDDWSA
ncbi:TetR/AcrR family transcriptional regulator [Gulosibacter faecalis]|jgi:AcrR family transcriptional regulator|uniref:TetR/AcrR family transcriptional regulator n=1 Tax=Gulosibacter faecalis TaxID=272240 RepID=A0ABW5UZ44_9MICO|nr:TetR/AcrR family transcriptional regulator [Gulosibacter faecalis]